MKKIAILFLSIILLFSLGTFKTEAAGDFVIDASGTLTDYNGNGGDVVIPDNVYRIGDYAFYQCKLTSVVIPDSVVSIGEYAFAGNDLTFVHIPDSVRSIDRFAFYGNDLATITIPGNVKTVSNKAFGGNSLSAIFVKEGVEELEPGAFGYGSAHTPYIVVPKSIKTGTGNFAEVSDNIGVYAGSSAVDNYATYLTLNEDYYYIDFSYDYVFGPNRYDTSIYAAEYLKKLMNVDTFSSIVIASGKNFPDALSGSYLANKNSAPILLINEKRSKDIQNFILNNLKYKGTIYVLGGEGAVPNSWLGKLSSSFNVVRLSGSDRYKTNIEILKKCGFNGGDILVCTGKNYADSLSASAIYKPILLVGSKLSSEQKSYLNSLKSKGLKFHIIGGTGAVSDSVVNELKPYGTVVKRYAGATRYDTSLELADAFFSKPTTAVLAYGNNYPDGLCAGPIAYRLGAPLLLTSSSKSTYTRTASYTTYLNIKKAVILGGPALVSEAATWKILGFKY